MLLLTFCINGDNCWKFLRLSRFSSDRLFWVQQKLLSESALKTMKHAHNQKLADKKYWQYNIEVIHFNVFRRNLFNSAAAGGGTKTISRDIEVMTGDGEITLVPDTDSHSRIQTQNTQIRLGRSYQDMLYEGMIWSPHNLSMYAKPLYVLIVCKFLEIDTIWQYRIYWIFEESRSEESGLLIFLSYV